MKNQKGITLVALVITIIVLLILAGVSISLVLGQNGVLTQASNAVVKNDAAAVEQEVKLAAAEAVTNYYEAWTQNANVKKSAYYIQTVFTNNCKGAESVTLDNNLIGDKAADQGSVKVTYKSNGSKTTYYFMIDVSTGEVSPSTADAEATAAP